MIELGEVRIGDLTERFDVSLMTMHRDLDDLSERRLLRKFRGRVAAYPALTMETAKRFREDLHLPQKEALCALAFGEISAGQTVFLDDSTTLFPLARSLGLVEGLVVFTNSLEITRLVGEEQRNEVILLGGRYTEFDSCIGPDVLATLRRIRADVALVSAAAIAEGKLYHPVREYAALKETALAAAHRNVLLADGSKFGKTATYAYGDVGEYDLVIVDDGVPEEELEAVRASGTRLALAETATKEAR